MADDHTLDYRDPEWVAERLGVDKNTVYKHLAAGLLPGVRLGRKWLISERALAEFLAQRAQEQTELRRALAKMTVRAAATLDAATEAAKRAGHTFVGQEHLLVGICERQDSLGAKMLVDLGVDLGDLGPRLTQGFVAEPGAPAGEAPDYSESLTAALLEARAQATKLGHPWFGVEHFVLGLVATPEGYGHELLTRTFGITLDAAYASCSRLLPAHVAANNAARQR